MTKIKVQSVKKICLPSTHFVLLFVSIAIIVIVICVVVITKYRKYKDDMVVLKIQELDTEYNNKYYKSVIPLKIYQTWHTKDLPVDMAICVNLLKHDNPEFEHFLFDDNDCLEFIKKHFSEEVVDAFNNLIPGAYKADLFRLCILYIQGGIYIDIKLYCVNRFKLIYLTQCEHLVDDNNFGSRKFGKFLPYSGIYNAFMICKAKNPFLMVCINAIVYNVKNKVYGWSPLHPTGPLLLGYEYTRSHCDIPIDMWHVSNGTILYNDIPIIESYPTYRKEQKANQKNLHYSTLWRNRNIYENETKT